MSSAISTGAKDVWTLPPLILHPFNERIPPSTLLENSRAALMLSGLIPSDGTEEDVLKRRLLSGRYAELRMLFFLGRDLMRWIDQCVEFAARGASHDAEIFPQNFAGMLITDPPEAVKQKLVGWGVSDYVSIFSRAIGLNAMFADPPEFAALNEEFLRNYHRYSDCLFRCYMDAYPALAGDRVRFDLYASGEYSRLLESEWAADGGQELH